VKDHRGFLVRYILWGKKFRCAYTEAVEVVAPHLLSIRREKRCPYCDKEFKSRHATAVHVVDVEMENLLADVEHIIAVVEAARRMIAESHRRPRYRCTLCGYRTTSLTDAVLHILNEHPEVVVISR